MRASHAERIFALGSPLCRADLRNHVAQTYVVCYSMGSSRSGIQPIRRATCRNVSTGEPENCEPVRAADTLVHYHSGYCALLEPINLKPMIYEPIALRHLNRHVK